MKKILPVITSIMVVGFFACQTSDKPGETKGDTDEFKVLVSYLQENGDMIAKAGTPYLIETDDIYLHLKGANYLVIDIRPEEEFRQGHIENAINVAPDKILDYFERKIEPNSFEKIAIVCANAQHSGYVVSILRMLGYGNTFNMRFGMSSWSDSVAQKYWYSGISDGMSGKLVAENHPKNESSSFPVIATGASEGFDILHQRAHEALQQQWSEISISWQEVVENHEDYYIINYWPEDQYLQGHLPGAVRYEQQQILSDYTLPTEKPVVLYCYSGHTSSGMSALLTILGYDVRSIEYGANAFMHSSLMATPPTTRAFSSVHVKNYPLINENENSSNNLTPEVKVEVTKVAGGC